MLELTERHWGNEYAIITLEISCGHLSMSNIEYYFILKAVLMFIPGILRGVHVCVHLPYSTFLVLIQYNKNKLGKDKWVDNICVQKELNT